MKIKSLMYVLMGTMLVTTSCSDNELEKGNDGSGTVDPVNASTLVNVYSDKSASEASLLVGDVFPYSYVECSCCLRESVYEIQYSFGNRSYKRICFVSC